eukprot:m51a1_g12818 hypothetical protein (80) ;mRNA; r:437-918
MCNCSAWANATACEAEGTECEWCGGKCMDSGKCVNCTTFQQMAECTASPSLCDCSCLIQLLECGTAAWIQRQCKQQHAE